MSSFSHNLEKILTLHSVWTKEISMYNKAKQVGLGMLILFGTALHSNARAQLSLTTTGSALGFTLSTFADGFPFANSTGPLGIGFRNDGGVIVTDAPGNVRVFSTDKDGQHAGSAVIGQTYGFGNAVGLSQIGNNFYMARQLTGDVVQINPDGTFKQEIVTGIPRATAVIANPSNGHLFVSSVNSNQIWDVDPIGMTKTLFAGIQADGLATDGSTLFAESNSHIVGYNILSKVQTFDSGVIPENPDGVAIGEGNISGNLFVNTNGGTLYEINTTTLAKTLIASGGTRGDFVEVDPNGSLLMTQTDSIMRLTPPSGGTFSATPEPGTLALLSSLGLCSCAGLMLRKRPRK